MEKYEKLAKQITQITDLMSNDIDRLEDTSMTSMAEGACNSYIASKLRFYMEHIEHTIEQLDMQD